MGFLSNLTLVQRAGGAAVLVLILVMLLMKQRQAKGAPAAKSADAKKGRSSKKRVSAPKEKKGRSFGSKRKSKSDDDFEMPVAEPKSGSGRMVPRLPAASEAAADEVATLEPVASSEVTGQALAVPMPTADGMISEPGWPTPGEVWAAPDAAVAESAEVGSWHAGAQDDALAALTSVPEAETSEWASDESAGLDESAGWATSSDDVPVPAAESDATWQAEEETFDWTAGDAIDGWATSAAAEPAEDLASGEAAWEAPEDESPSWSANETTEWDAVEPVEETASVATAVAEEFSVSDWAAPATADEVVADEPNAAAEAVPEIIWDPVDEVEDVGAEMALKTDVVVAESETEVAAPGAEASVVEEPAVAVFEAPVVEEPAVAVLATPVVEEPAVAVFEAPVVEEPAVAVLATPVVEEPAVAVFETPVVEGAQFAVEAPVASVPAVAPVADPTARWASMAPGGVTEGRSVASPVDSWTRLRPGQTVPVAINGTNGHHASHTGSVATAVAPMPTAAEVTSPSLAWWDVPSGMESDPRRGRFALGGYALQPGHQVVSGVTFREGVVPPPTHWVIGPVVGEVAPGTLVLQVDGCLNCHPQDLAVLTDHGFAPTTDGFSLRLAAAATGPFAVSGTYIIT